MKRDEIRAYNREAWNRAVSEQNRWTVPTSPEAIARARTGDVEFVLTPSIPVPAAWFMPVAGREILCLASGGGQQGPLLAAAGGHVTVFDNSPAQLGRDREVASRERLTIATEEGDMRDLSRFEDGRFDLIVHPCANGFIEDIRPLWSEAFRVLRPGGTLIAGFCNPIIFTFDPDLQERGTLQVKYAVPYSDLTSLTEAERSRYTDKGEPLSFGHTLEDQIGGQLEAGFVLTGFFEDRGLADDPLRPWFAGYAATRARKPQ